MSPKYHRRRVVYTSLFGSSEAFNDFTYERDPDIDFVCFTDDSELRSNFWRVEYVPSGLLDPPRASKKVKHLPHRYLSAYRESLYLDNTVQLKRPARELFEELLCPSPSPWVAFRHPWRQCIYDEADEVVRLGYDAPERVNAQVQFYRRLGYPPKNGLVKGAALLRRHHDPAVVAVGEDWFQQVLRHSVRDQISLPVVAWHHGFLFCLLDQDFLDNEFVQWPVHGPRLPRDFDEDRYLSLNPDVHGTDPRRHYLRRLSSNLSEHTLDKSLPNPSIEQQPGCCSKNDAGSPLTRAAADFSMIGRRCGTDKIEHHGYHRYYPPFIEYFRTINGGAMLEIGIDQQHSLQTWLEYYPNALIYGIDIGVEREGPRYTIFKADQSDLKSLETIAKTKIQHPIFLILDDGSHIPEHQALSFNYLFSELLLPGGVYIIEDIETSYWTKDGLYGYQTRYGYRHPNSIIELFKSLVDELNRECLTEANRNAQDRFIGDMLSAETREAVSSITFGQNCIIITKKTEEERAYDGRAYRFESHL